MAKNLRTELEKAISGLNDITPEQADRMKKENTCRWLISMMRVSGSLLSADRLMAMIRGESVEDATIEEFQRMEASKLLRSEFSYMLEFDTYLDKRYILKFCEILCGKENTEYRKELVNIRKFEFRPPGPVHISELMDACCREIASDDHSADVFKGAVRTYNMLISIWPFEKDNGVIAYAAMSYELLNAGFPLPTIVLSQDMQLRYFSEFMQKGQTPEFEGALLENLIKECCVR